MRQRSRVLYRPSGRVGNDRKEFGTWLYQRGSVIFIGEVSPHYWIHKHRVEQDGLAFWVKQINGKLWAERTGWTREEIEKDFRAACKHMAKTKV